MRHRNRTPLMGAAGCLACLASLALAGCGEPTGDDAYSQKFEPPANAPAAAEADAPNPYAERSGERDAEPEPGRKRGRR